MAQIHVIAHRGANIYAPQNTMPAFQRALEIGVDGFETDVHLTQDGKLVLCHNYTIDKTSNGKGSISQMTLGKLKTYDFGSYFSPKFADTRIPALKEAFASRGSSLGALGRWGTRKYDDEGNLNAEEFEGQKVMLDTAAQLGCPVYISGVEYNEKFCYEFSAGTSCSCQASCLPTTNCTPCR